MPKEARLRVWLAIVGTATILLVTAYGFVQQSMRLGANDAPYAAAQIAKHQLESGVNAADVVPEVKTDSLSDTTLFVIVTDDKLQILASSLNDTESVRPPTGVFTYAAIHGRDSVTWQTGAGARLATTVIPYKSGFVVAGQSLSQIEKRATKFTVLMIVAWLVVVGWTYLVLWLYI